MPALAQVDIEQNASERVQPPTPTFREEWDLGVCDEEDMQRVLCVKGTKNTKGDLHEIGKQRTSFEARINGHLHQRKHEIKTPTSPKSTTVSQKNLSALT